MSTSFKDIQELKTQWNTTKELFEFLALHGFQVNVFRLRCWEKKGIIPKPKRIEIRTIEWRVYDKEGKDFQEILENLNKRKKTMIFL